MVTVIVFKKGEKNQHILSRIASSMKGRKKREREIKREAVSFSQRWLARCF